MHKHPYKRSWRNLVLDPTYQLVFTLVLVGTCAAFMFGLGWVVVKQVDSATETAKANINGERTLDPEVARQAIAKLEGRQRLLVWILVGVGAAITGGLFVYGIKMTHHVAGPLYKVSLYCDKITHGKFDKVHNLRRGDQLHSFYDHFRHAYDALKAREQRDVECLKEVVSAAEAMAEKPPDVVARLDELKALLKTKEASLV
ncbi:MAG TPA: hypothetical protein VKE22_09575 [Haliangiales bacterium]|nr:hypothetical protein [Haliangiales bacterium]